MHETSLPSTPLAFLDLYIYFRQNEDEKGTTWIIVIEVSYKEKWQNLAVCINPRSNPIVLLNVTTCDKELNLLCISLKWSSHHQQETSKVIQKHFVARSPNCKLDCRILSSKLVFLLSVYVVANMWNLWFTNQPANHLVCKLTSWTDSELLVSLWNYFSVIAYQKNLT